MITKLNESQQAGRKIRETASVFDQCGSSKADVAFEEEINLQCVVKNSDNCGDKCAGYGKENCVWALEENFGNKQDCDREIASLSTSELLKKLLQSKQRNKNKTEVQEQSVNCKEKFSKRKRSVNKKANSDLVCVSNPNNGRMDNSSKQIRQSPSYNENTSSNSFEEEDLPVIPQEVLYNQTIDFLLAEAERTLSLESPTNSVHSIHSLHATSPEIQQDFTEPQPFIFSESASLPALCTQLSNATTSSRHSSENVSVERQESVHSSSEEEKDKEDNLTDDATEIDKEAEDPMVLVPSSKLISYFISNIIIRR